MNLLLATRESLARGGDDRLRFLGLVAFEEHLDLVTARADGPFLLGGHVLAVGVLGAVGVGLGRRRELLGSLLEALLRLGVQGIGFLRRDRGGLGPVLHAQPAQGDAQVVEGARMIRELLDAGNHLQLLGGTGEVRLGLLEERQGQAKAGGGRILVVGKLGQEVPVALQRDGIVFLVECLAGVGQGLFGRLVIRRPGRQNDGRQQNGRGGQGEESAATISEVVHCADLLGGMS